MGLSALAVWAGVKSVIEKIPFKFIAIMASVVLLLVCVIWIEKRVGDHFERVRGLETAKAELTAERNRLRDDLREAGQINTANQAAHKAELAQITAARAIAEDERRLAQSRADFYRRAYDAANATPEAERLPVDPVIRDTVDRLWDNAPGS